MLRYGIAGCGGIAKAHADAIAKTSGSKVVAVEDVLPESAKAMAEQLKCEWYADYHMRTTKGS